jgi:hypothetical protein
MRAYLTRKSGHAWQRARPHLTRKSGNHLPRHQEKAVNIIHRCRFARWTNAFSKKLKSFQAAVAIILCYYNFVNTLGAIHTTPVKKKKLFKWVNKKNI